MGTKNTRKSVTVGRTRMKYTDLHDALQKMTEPELREAMQKEIDSPDPRSDALARMLGRFNRLRGERCKRNVLGLLGYKGKRDVNAALDSNR